MASAEELRIEVAYSPAVGSVQQVMLRLPPGSRVQDALQQAYPDLALDNLVVGVWGKLRALSDTLRDQDRVEVYRPLLVDPKEARRLRYKSHRAKAKP
ncbi:MAG: RnfH family protein [Cytophagales bacterium]|nr:RnfH family protein [Rhizobacter sp.]